MSIQLDKPWRQLTEENVVQLGGQLGIYQLADSEQKVIYIGFAGARSLFGLRGELTEQMKRAAFFRVEVNTAYRTRWRELMMIHFASYNEYPDLNTPYETQDLGSLSISHSVQ